MRGGRRPPLPYTPLSSQEQLTLAAIVCGWRGAGVRLILDRLNGNDTTWYGGSVPGCGHAIIGGMEILRDGAAKLGIHLSAGQLEKFAAYRHELTEWNRRMNLTAITDCREVHVKHFLDSLTVTLALENGACSLADVGTGAGFPGIPLKIWSPDMRLTLFEATGKKAQFLAAVVRRLGLEGVTIVNTRAEDAAHEAQYRESFDVVVARGLAPMPVLAELTLPLCRLGGRVIAPKKGEISAEIALAARAVSVLGGGPCRLRRIDLSEFSEVRWLAIVDKLAPTPDKYPRRPGVPAKRPIQ